MSDYRREKQLAYNQANNITPRSVSRAVEESLSTRPGSEQAMSIINDAGGNFDITETLRELEEEMLSAANNLEFEKAALLRDQIRELKRGMGGAKQETQSRSVSYKRLGRSSRAKAQ